MSGKNTLNTLILDKEIIVSDEKILEEQVNSSIEKMRKDMAVQGLAKIL